MDRGLVASGTTQVAIRALSGRGMAARVGNLGLSRKLHIVNPIRMRQAHLDVIIMGGLVTAAGLVDDVPPWARNATRIGAWTNPLLFVPMAFKKDASGTKAYMAA